jgi:hypothetical protein
MTGSQLGLARLAAEAEMLRLRQLARRTAWRVALGYGAVIFLFAALTTAHGAIWLALQPAFSPLQALLAITAGDLVIGLVLAVLACRSRPGPVERDALRLRNDARRQLINNGRLIRLLVTLWTALRRR